MGVLGCIFLSLTFATLVQPDQILRNNYYSYLIPWYIITNRTTCISVIYYTYLLDTFHVHIPILL